MSKTLSAIAKLLRVRRILFLGLTGTGFDDFDGRMIAAALEDAPHRVSAGKTGSDADRFHSRNPGPPLGGGREGRRARVVEQPRWLLNNTQNVQDTECNRQVVARAAYSVSWIDRNRFGRL